MIITISGLPGSGKSSVGRELAKRLNYEFMSVGDLRGQMAIAKGLTLDELNKLGETEDWTDKEADEKQKEIGRTKDNLVMEGRLSWHFIPNSFKVLLTVDLPTSAKRILQNTADRPDEKEPLTLAEAENMIKERIVSDDRRYQKYYGLNYLDHKNYDLVIDTSSKPIAKIVAEILDKVKYKV
jgi:cytidylate kinase